MWDFRAKATKTAVYYFLKNCTFSLLMTVIPITNFEEMSIALRLQVSLHLSDKAFFLFSSLIQHFRLSLKKLPTGWLLQTDKTSRLLLTQIITKSLLWQIPSVITTSSEYCLCSSNMLIGGKRVIPTYGRKLYRNYQVFKHSKNAWWRSWNFCILECSILILEEIIRDWEQRWTLHYVSAYFLLGKQINTNPAISWTTSISKKIPR